MKVNAEAIQSLIDSGFVNESLTQFTLPFPLGTKVYRVSTDCCDACTFYPERRKVCGADIRCSVEAVCHTKARKPYEEVFVFGNMIQVMLDLGSFCFTSYDEAVERTEELVSGRVIGMRLLGFPVRDDGSIVVREKLRAVST